jgi:hypothetical protein
MVPVECVLLIIGFAVPCVYLQLDWDANTAVFSLVNLLRTRAARINLNFNPQNLP